MKAAGFVLVSLFALNGFSAISDYKVDTKVYLNDHPVPAREAKVKVLSISKADAKLKDGILMKLAVEVHSNGKTVRSTPEILTRPGSEATIFVSEGEAADELKVKVSAQSL
jgi:hypothetical protein